ncbi:MAG: hypothetical protein ACOC56_04035 [Atribacterota bacterium]
MKNVKNYLNGKTVYLAGSIHHNNVDSGVDWREKLTPQLENFGLNVIDPCKKTINEFSEIGQDKEHLKQLIKDGNFAQVREIFFPILKSDLRCVDISHFIIVNYIPKIRHVGTIHEIVMANFEKKPILLYYPKEQLEEFNPWIACLIKEKHFFNDWNKMLEYLTNVDNGNFDTSLWY